MVAAARRVADEDAPRAQLVAVRAVGWCQRHPGSISAADEVTGFRHAHTVASTDDKKGRPAVSPKLWRGG